MHFRTRILAAVLALIFSILACNMPTEPIQSTPAPTDSGFQLPPGQAVPTLAPQGDATQVPAALAPAPGQGAGADIKRFTLATTSTLMVSGMLPPLVGNFQKQSGYQVKVETGGSGRALKLARKGIIGVLLVNEPDDEKKFMEEGYGKDRIPLFYTDALLVGPPGDPAGIKGMKNATEAFKKIAEKKALFFSPGEDSSAYKTELYLWKLAGVTTEDAPWYVAPKEGNEGTLKIANDQSGYTLIDRATFLTIKKTLGLDLEVMVEGAPSLLNVYNLITMNPEKAPKVDQAGVAAIVQYLTSAEVQDYIAKYGVDQYGQQVFFPGAPKP
jgi:tungstate transport system substrate-binding protein